MKKLMLFVLLIFVMLSTSGFAYTDSGAAFYCNNCSDCTDALNDNIRSTVYLNADIIDYSGAICINNPTQFSNKIFDCQQHTISGGETYNGIFLNTKTNNIIRNCVMTDFSIAIRIYNSDNNILNNNTFTSNDYGISFESSSAYNNITNSTINFNRVGIWSSQGYNNTMINNALNHNNYYGTELATSDNSTMINNTMENNTLLSVLVTGQAYDDFDLNIDTTNTVNGKPIYYLFNKSDLILNQVNETGHIFLAYSNNITIENITISNGDYIYLKSTTNTTIHNTSVTNSNYGIYIRSSSYNNLTNITANSNSNYGIYIGSSSYNNLTNITANSNSNYGIYIDSSSYNNLTNITANSNDYGFYIYGSYGNNLTNARMSNNTYNFGVYGTTLSHYYNDIDTTNTVEGKTIYYYKNTSDILIDSSNVGYVAFISSTNVTFRDNNLPSNIYGLSLINTTHSDVLDNTFNSDYRAIILFFGSANNTISGNTIATTQYGIWIDSSDNNSITDNTISTNFGIGMRIQSSDFTEVKTSTITSSECGITLSSSYNNTISANTLNSNDYALRFISSPLNSTIINNIGSFNNYSSERLTYLEGNTISGNRIKATEDDIDELYYGNSSVLIEINQSGEKIGYELSWRKSATGYYDEYSGPAIVNGIVYVPNKGFLGIMAFNETTGEEIWRHYTGKTDDTPTYVDGVIYTGPGVPETDIKYKKIYALNATTGELIWNYTNETSGGTPAVWNNRLYWLARYGPKYLYALNTTPEPLTDLQRHLWNYSIATGTLETSTTAIEGVVYGGSDSGNLFALNATNGTEIWSVAIGGVWDSTPMISGERLYIGTRGNGIKCLNKTNGNVFWTGGGGNIYSVITLHNDVVFGGGKNDVLYALNATDGTSIWSYTTDGDIYSTPAIAGNDVVYFGSLDYKIYGLNETTGYSLWTYTTGGKVYSQPAIANGKLFVGADDWYFRVFNLGEGAGNWTTLGYNQSRNAVTPDGLTAHMYVHSICNTSGSTVTCNVTNNYNKDLSRVILKNTNNIQQATYDNKYLLYVYNDKIILPKISAGETLYNIEIIEGIYNSSLPYIIDTKNEYFSDNYAIKYLPNYLQVLDAYYIESNYTTVIRVNGTGTNKNITLNYTILSDFNIFDNVYSSTTPVIEVISGSVTTIRNNFLAEYNSTNGTLFITIPSMSEHILTITGTPPVRSNGSPTTTITSTSATVSLTTNEAAVCRYATSSGISYSSMLSSTTLSTSHSWPVETIVPGTYTYYVRCNDTLGNYNTDDYTISFTKRATVIGDGGGFDIQPITIIPETRPVPNPSDTGTETSIADIPLNRPYQIPSGGLCMKVAEGLCISVFGDSVTVHNVTKIDPNQFKVLLCNQTYLEAFEINVTADNVYLCFDTTTVDTKAVSIYSFNGDWNQLTNITQIGNQICGRITSTPYMVAGFKSSDLQQLALDAIADSEKRLLTNSDSELENILNQAKDAYYNCDYQNAYDLSQKIFWSSTISGIQLPLITTFGPANTILEMMIYSLVAKLLGYETVYIDLLPIFDLSNPGKLDFRYITPVIGVVPSGTGNLYEEIESDEIVNPDIYKDRQDV